MISGIWSFTERGKRGFNGPRFLFPPRFAKLGGMTKKNPDEKRGGKREGAGPKPKIINWKTVKNLCHILATKAEICAILEIDEKTLTGAILREHGATWEQFFSRHSSMGKTSLRRQQYRLAMKGNATMLIWLGKQALDQKDRAELGFDPNRPIRFKLKMGKQLEGKPDV